MGLRTMATLPSTGQQTPPPAAADLSAPAAGAAALAAAFRDFNLAAGVLQQSYGHLQAEVARLRRELQGKNRDLARRAEENQRLSARLEQILSGLPCGVIVAAGNTVRAANPAARRLLAPVAPDLDAGSVLPPRLRTTSGAEALLALRGDRYLAVSAAPLGQGEEVWIVRDATGEQRRRREEERERQLRALAEMSAVLAHEIRNPLASLELFAGLLAETSAEGEARNWIAQVQAGLRQMAATVNNVLQLHSGAPVQLAPLPLNEFLRATVDFLRPLAEQQGVRMELATGPEGVAIAADPNRLRQVLFNLAVNAFRAMAPRPDGVLRIAADVESGRRVRLTLRDQGPGFAPDVLPRIFAPGFSRAGGAGLGLAVCRQIMRQHGGEMDAGNAAAADGAVITLRLWRWPAPQALGGVA